MTKYPTTLNVVNDSLLIYSTVPNKLDIEKSHLNTRQITGRIFDWTKKPQKKISSIRTEDILQLTILW